MPCWYSPWPVAATLEAHLQAAGLVRCGEPLEALPSDAVILYSPPDVLLATALETATLPPSPQQLAEGYARVQSFGGGQRLIASWRLEGLTTESIGPWLLDSVPMHCDRPFPKPEPITALLTKTLLESQPTLLDAYLDLELVAELAGGPPDTGYPQRLAKAFADPQPLLEAWWLPHKQLQTSLQERAAQFARAEALTGESLQARQEAESLRLELHGVREERERLVEAGQAQAARIGQLQSAMETETAKVAQTEADLAQFRSEHASMAQERDAVTQEKTAALAAVSNLTHQLSGQTEALRLALEAQTQHLAKVKDLESEVQRARQEREGLQLELHHVQEELERLFLADQTKAARIGQLQDALGIQSTRSEVLEAELVGTRSERDGALREREALAQEKAMASTTVADLNHQLSGQTEALRLAREAEAQHLAKAEALEGEKWQARDEARRLLAQLHHLQEELEETFLRCQAADQLVAAQHQQLQRAQSLMSRLLVQATRNLLPSQAIAVEVLPPRLPGSLSRSLPGGRG
jgi:chromosome segregation ATPase